ncbi:MAG TPA: HU family DNA-binding protein [Solirubrobacteraceae bacterium]|nr:HU family DNA-binding protein [Solirubrobacteraceae bacterium]
MRKSDLVADIARRTGLSQAESGRALDATLAAIEESLASGGEITITGFGKFKTTQRAARTGVNPASGAPVHIPATTVPRFVAGSRLKQAVR